MGREFSARLINIVAAAVTGAGLLLGTQAGNAQAATVVAQVDISEQTMRVMVDGREAYQWKVSTAGRGYRTPTGTFKPQRMHKMWYSKKYDNAPMPHSIFFHGGYAVHATDAIKRLGQPASHGCVRLHPEHASSLYHLVKDYGPQNTQIVIVD